MSDKLTKESTELASKIDYEDDGWEDLFNRFGFEHRKQPNGNAIKLNCPTCLESIGKKNSIYFWSDNPRSDYPTWRCYHCNAERKYHSSFIGLFRFLLAAEGVELSPFQVLNFLKDVVDEPFKEIRNGKLVEEEEKEDGEGLKIEDSEYIF